MKKLSLSITIVLMVGMLVTASVSASGLPKIERSLSTFTPGPYEGSFSGTVSSDNGSQAPISMNLTHRGDVVEGSVSLGNGLSVNGGVCGTVDVPSVEQHITGTSQPDNPNQISTQMAFEVSGINIVVDLNSQISSDGSVIQAQTAIDLPWLCGRDPLLSGSLNRIES